MQTMKTMLAATVGLACGAASAQSGVTIFGVVDTNVQQTRADGVGRTTGVGNGGYATSRIGFRGTEDLGGGLSAGFWLEGSLNTDTGSGRSTNTNNQPSGATVAGGLTFDRMSYVSLAHARWGEVRLGHDFIPTHYNSIYYDPFNANGVGRAGNLTFTGSGNGPLSTAIVGSNTVSYWLPKNLGGVFGMAMVGRGENASGAANPHDGNLVGGRLGYAAGPVNLAAAATRTRYATTATLGDYTHANVGGTWEAGFAKFFALYNVVKVDLLAGEVRKHTAEVGVHVPVGTFGRIRASYIRLDDRSEGALRNANGTARSNNDARQFGLGYVHDLSKRTALYSNYARLQNRGQATFLVSGGQAPLPGRDSSGLEFGIRHLF